MKKAIKQLVQILPPELIAFVKRKLKKEKGNSIEDWKNLSRYTEFKINFQGAELKVPDNASFKFMAKEIFDEKIYQFKTLKESPYIIDGGANIGLSAIFFKKEFPEAKIIAFEPDEKIGGYLKFNLNSFGFKDIQVVNKGLWNENTTLEFTNEGADAGLLSGLDNNSKPTNKVEVVSLKPYLNEHVDFLKLDIEGAETVVLNDIKNELGMVDRIFVEYHSFVGQNQSLDDIITILTEANFRLYVTSPGVSSKRPFIEINSYNNMDMQLNIYGFKENLE